MQIPKIIHYCWFGGNPKPDLAQKCISSWKKFLPDYEIKEWNESNYNVRKNLYISQAYDKRKFAFVSDYARFDILYQYGGAYFDTDVEIIKDLHPILEKGSFIAIEKGDRPLLNAGLGIASSAGSTIYREILDSYKSEIFVKEDGSLNLKTVCDRVSEIFQKYGFVEKDILQNVADTTIYPSDYFCPKDCITGEINISINTNTIHHYDGSWTTEAQKKYDKKRQSIYKTYGRFWAKVFLFPFFIKWQLTDNGMKVFFKKMYKRIRKF